MGRNLPTYNIARFHVSNLVLPRPSLGRNDNGNNASHKNMALRVNVPFSVCHITHGKFLS